MRDFSVFPPKENGKYTILVPKLDRDGNVAAGVLVPESRRARRHRCARGTSSDNSARSNWGGVSDEGLWTLPGGHFYFALTARHGRT